MLAILAATGVSAQFVIDLNDGSSVISNEERLVFTGDEASGYTTLDGSVKLEDILQIYSPDKLVNLKITKVTSIGVEFDVIPSNDDINYFYAIMTIEKANGLDEDPDNGYTTEELVDFDRAWWEFVASMYNGNWVDFAKNDLRNGQIHDDNVETFPALKWDTDNVLYAYGLDDQGEVSTPVCAIEFRTQPRVIDPEQNFTIDFKRVIARSAEFTVTPAKETPYLVTVQKQSFVDLSKDPETGEISDDMMYKTIYNSVSDGALDYMTHSGEEFFDQSVFANRTPDTDYCIIVFGFDKEKGATTDATIVPFHTLKFTDLSLCVDKTTATGVEFTIVPTKDEIKYFYSIMSLEDAKALDGDAENGYLADELFTNQKKYWEMDAQYGSGDWLQEAAADLVTKATEGGTNASIIPVMKWDTEYVLYAFGLNTDTGELTTPVRTCEFRTAQSGTSDNDIEVTIDNIYNNRVDYTITTTNSDTYFVDVQRKKSIDYYYNPAEGTGDEQTLAYWLIEGKSKQGFLDNYIFSGDKTVAPEASIGLSGGQEHYVVVFGFDKEGGLTTPVKLVPFKTKKSTDLTIKVDALSPTTVDFTIVPTKNTINYFYTMMSSADAEAINPDSEGYDPQELFDNQVSLWKAAAGEENWVEEATAHLVSGKTSTTNATFIPTLEPGTSYVILAFGLNTDGTTSTPITVKEFATPTE